MNTFSKVSAQAFQQRTFVPGQGQLLRYRFCHGGTIQPAKGNRGGWDVTIAPTDFRKIDQKVICEVIDFLNQIEGRPYFGEGCTGLVERAFGKRRVFADSPTAGLIGFGMRVGDPAAAGNAAPYSISSDSSESDRLSYALGVDIGRTLKRLKLDLDQRVLIQGVRNILNRESMALDDKEVEQTLELVRSHRVDTTARSEVRDQAQKGPSKVDRVDENPALEWEHLESADSGRAVQSSSENDFKLPKEDQKNSSMSPNEPPAPSLPAAHNEPNTVTIGATIDADETRLQAVYNQLGAKLGSVQKEALRQDEMRWIKSKDSLPPNSAERLKTIQNRIRVLEEQLNGRSTTNSAAMSLEAAIATSELQLQRIYDTLRPNLSSNQREALKKEEIQWIKWKDSLSPNSVEKLKAIQNRIQVLETRSSEK